MKQTQKRLCASCLKFNFNKTIKSNKKQKPKWLNKIDYVEQFVKNYKNFKVNYPKQINKHLKLFIGKQFANRKILFWGAEPSNHTIINDAKSAYKNFSNSGVAIIDKMGFALIKFMTPQNYKTQIKGTNKMTSFFKHIHYVISNNDNNKWQDQIYTKLVSNNFNYQEFSKNLNSKLYIVLNVLPSHVYAQDHIPNTFNLPYNKINKMSIEDLNKWFLTVIKLHYKKIHDLLSKKKLELYEIPIICYCAHNKCNASSQASQELMKKGFVNVNLYEDGMKGYKKLNNI